MTDTLGWEAVEEELEHGLSVLPVGSSLMLKLKDSEGIQLTFELDQLAGLRLSAPSDRFLKDAEALRARGDRAMRTIGWLPPVGSAIQGHRSPTTYYREWPHPIPFAEAVQMAITTFRSIFGVGSPSELGYEAYFPGGRFEVPGLSLEPVKELLLGPTAESSVSELEEYLEAYLAEIAHTVELEREEHGAFVLRSGSATIFAGVQHGDPPYAWLVAPLLWGAEGSEELLAVVNEINLSLAAGRAVWDEGRVLIIERFPNYILDIQTIVYAFDEIARVADEYDDILRVRFNGKTPSSGERPEARTPTGYL